jgi:Cu(I)/Ag(I) efflux system membrane fusion protein
MDLVTVETNPEQEERGPVIALSDKARRLARIRTVPVERRAVTVDVRMAGKIDYDETRIGDITSYVPGRLERLYVDYTGLPVNQGDHMVDIYSPELLAAQEELLQAIQARLALEHSELPIMRDTAEQTVNSAREKLRLWGLLPRQIEEIERQGTADERITLYSPMTGVVIEKHANQGMYVDTGSRIYTIADLAHLWARLEAYESDMEWIHLGQEVEFTAEAYPGTVFSGRVSFIDPIVDPRTRTVRLRVNLSNADLRLKPGMLVRAVAKGQYAGAGRVFDPYLAGKWICPMHPEVVENGAGACEICGMPLVPSAELGFVARPASDEAPLVIPDTAPLITGKRAVVYVEDSAAEKPTYEGREVVLGPKAGSVYIVKQGLAEGERVVIEGNFKIDSALQIQAKPSMMSPSGSTRQVPPEHRH